MDSQKKALSLIRKEDDNLEMIGSFDIAIKNLAICILKKLPNGTFQIHRWKLLSLVSQQHGKKVLKYFPNFPFLLL